MKKTDLRIGNLASRIGVHPETIRYYEHRGLLPRPARTHGGYRVYTPEHLERVEFIKWLQPLGFSLEEIRSLLAAKFDAALPSQHARDVLRKALTTVDRHIAQLASTRQQLRQLLRSAE